MCGDQSGKFVCGNNWELNGSGTLYMYSGQVSVLKSQCLLVGCKNDFPRKPLLFCSNIRKSLPRTQLLSAVTKCP